MPLHLQATIHAGWHRFIEDWGKSYIVAASLLPIVTASLAWRKKEITSWKTFLDSVWNGIQGDLALAVIGLLYCIVAASIRPEPLPIQSPVMLPAPNRFVVNRQTTNYNGDVVERIFLSPESTDRAVPTEFRFTGRLIKGGSELHTFYCVDGFNQFRENTPAGVWERVSADKKSIEIRCSYAGGADGQLALFFPESHGPIEAVITGKVLTKEISIHIR
jgi:hypothetical protein